MKCSIQILSVVTCWLLLSSSLLAHHGSFYKTVYRAIQKADLDDIQELFSKSAWDGTKGRMSGPELQARLKKGELIPLHSRSVTYLNEYASNDEKRSKCLVTFKLKYTEGEKQDEQIWLLAERIDFKVFTETKSWQIARIENRKEEAESFLDKKLP